MNELKELKDRLNKLNQLLDKLDERLVQGEISEAKYKELSEKYRAEAESLKNQITEKELLHEVGLKAEEKEAIAEVHEEDEEQLIHNLRRLLTEGGEGNYLIASAGKVYIQFAANRGEQQIYCEAVSNQFLPPNLHLNEGKISQLQALGFETGRDSPNFSRTFYIVDSHELREIARTTLSILSNVYGISPRSRIQFELHLESGTGGSEYRLTTTPAYQERKKGSVKEAFIWMLLLSLLLFWVPFLGSFIVGFTGGKKAGSAGRAVLAGIIPIILMFALSVSVFGNRSSSLYTDSGAIIASVLLIPVIVIIGAIIGSRSNKKV